jgi:hypothetical protein
MPAKPMLDGFELQYVQEIECQEEEALAQHGIPALEGDFLEDLGRRAIRVTLAGVLAGTDAGDNLKALREKFKSGTPVAFVDDIATATTVDKMLIEDLNIREVAGKPERFEYALSLYEYIAAQAPGEETQQIPGAPQVDAETQAQAADANTQQVSNVATNTGTLEVQVNLAESGDDYSGVVVVAESSDGQSTSQNQQTNGIYRFENVPAGDYTVRLLLQ